MIGWSKPPLGWVKLNTNGTSKQSTFSATTGGLIRDTEGNWLRGFSQNIGWCSSLNAELWGVYTGLTLAWNQEYRRVELEVDSAAVINILSSADDRAQTHNSIVLGIDELFHRNWTVVHRHVYRESNKCADWLAHYAEHVDVGVTYFDTTLIGCHHFLTEDRSGICFPRFIM